MGNMLEEDNSMKVDLSLKRGAFIGKTHSLFQEFHYMDPDVLVKIMTIFNSSFYGSNLWVIFSSNCDKIYESWNVHVLSQAAYKIRKF